MKLAELPISTLLDRLKWLRYRRKDKSTGYIYGFTDFSIFGDGTAVKIGHGQTWRNRICQEQVGNPRWLIPVFAIRVWNHKTLELELHAHLKERHIRGEWFSLTAEHIATLIKELVDQGGTHLQ